MDPETLAALVASATRSPGDRHRLDGLLGRLWPGGQDRLEPAATRWVRRWGPQRATVAPAACECALGRCPVCN